MKELVDRHCVVLGGGGWMMEEEDSYLDRYIISLANRKKPRICLLATACGDADFILDRYYSSKVIENCDASHISFFRVRPDWKSYLLEQDIIYVGGGNTKTMLAIWKEWGVDQTLKEFYQRGKLLAGMSAGALCWFESGLTDSYGKGLRPIGGLGFLPGAFCSHYNQEDGRREIFKEYIGLNPVSFGYGVDDGVGLHFKNEQLWKVIKHKSQNNAFYLEKGKEVILNDN